MERWWGAGAEGRNGAGRNGGGGPLLQTFTSSFTKAMSHASWCRALAGVGLQSLCSGFHVAPHAFTDITFSLCVTLTSPLTPPFFQTGIVGPHVKHGIKLLGNGKNFLNTPLHLEVTSASKSAIAAVEKVRCW